MRDILDCKIDINRVVRDFIKRFENIYLSIDIDVLDKRIVPGTGYPVSNGFLLRDLVDILKIIKDSKKVTRMDLVEVNPDKDVDAKTVDCACEILRVFL